MATDDRDVPHLNSQPPKNDAPAVICSVARPERGTGMRSGTIFLLAGVVSFVIHVVLLSLFLLVTVNSSSASVTSVREIQTLMEDDKPRQENLTNEDIGLDPNEALNYNIPRIEPVSVPGPANPTEEVGNSNVAESPPMNVPPPLGIGADGQGGGLKTPAAGLMNLNDFGGGLPKGIGQPGGFLGRSGGTRQQMVKEGGGNTASEAAVARGIKWMVQHQAPDGHWSLDGFNQHGRCNCNGFGQSNDIAATAFGLLPLLGAGETHKKKDGIYSKNVQRGLNYLILKQAKDGNYGGGMYAHGLATIAMCEAYGLTADKTLLASAQRAVNFIRYAQSESGGWRYEPRSGGDTSVVGWQVMALKSGQMSGLEVDDVRNPTLAKATKFLKSCAVADETAYGYTGPDANSPTMTAVGLLCRLYLGTGVRNSGIVGGVNRLKQQAPPGSVNSLYYYYYATQVMHHVGGPAWDFWNPKMRDLLIAKQDKGTTPNRKHQYGSWSPAGDAHAGAGGRLMITSLSILTLEVYYRHLPLYRRNMGEKGIASN